MSETSDILDIQWHDGLKYVRTVFSSILQ